MQQKELESGYIVYVDKMTDTVHHQDPNVGEILRKIAADFDHIKYVTYRCSAKLNSLSEALFSNSMLLLFFI